LQLNERLQENPNFKTLSDVVINGINCIAFINEIRRGVNLDFEGGPERRFMKNYASCFVHEAKVNESISRYHAAKYLSGPFDREPIGEADWWRFCD
jgi:hypothetical protein